MSTWNSFGHGMVSTGGYCDDFAYAIYYKSCPFLESNVMRTVTRGSFLLRYPYNVQRT